MFWAYANQSRNMKQEYFKTRPKIETVRLKMFSLKQDKLAVHNSLRFFGDVDREHFANFSVPKLIYHDVETYKDKPKERMHLT